MSADATPAAPAVVAPAPTHLLKPLKVGNIEVKNRVWMAPLTRCRAEMPGHVPGALIAEMYEQRATSGLLIAEATMVTADSSGFYTEPGCYNEAQAAGWKLTTDAVHRAGGKIYLQIVHCGRQAHPSNNNGVQPVAPSAIAVPDHKVAAQHNPTGEPVPYVEPRELSDAEVVEMVAAFAHSAKLAIQAGFDGVEIHAANGYLIAQFLAAHANKRTSGPYANTSIETRAKFLLDIVQACAAAVGGADKLGVRISPVNHYGQGAWVDPEADTAYVASHLDALGVGYLHIMRASFFPPFAQIDLIALCRQHFKRGVLVSNMGYEPDTAEQEVASGRVDAIAFGRPFISNPDLVHRIAKQIPLAPSDHTTYYTHGAKGYTDYPVATA